MEREQIDISASEFRDAIDQGDWSGHDAYLRDAALRIRTMAESAGVVGIHYFALAEVPHAIAFGAHMGSERAVILHDYDRDRGAWSWAAGGQTIRLVTRGADDLKYVVRARGPVVIRVAVSAVVTDSDVRDVLGDETLADVTITLAEAEPTVATIRTAEDAQAVRTEFRRVFAGVQNSRPNLDTVHLFVAAPPSVCFAIGQELALRNVPPVQTYRFRKSQDGNSLQPAILLTATGATTALEPLSQEQIQIAARVRTVIWPEVASEIENFAKNQDVDHQRATAWFQPHVARNELRQWHAFTALPMLARLIGRAVVVDREPFSGEYGFEEENGRWRLGDRLLVGLVSAVDGDESRLRQLVRLFLFHEYIHLYQGLTKHTAAEVGKFPNCLEYLDYEADAYAVLQQWDLMRHQHGNLLPGSFDTVRAFLAEQIELAIRSFWAFDTGNSDEWQVRRIRRYLNWYWRLTQIHHADDLEAMIRLLSKQPRIELGGLHQIARGRRVLTLLNRLDKTTHLELAIVLENDTVYRVADSPNANLPELLSAFRQAEHDKIRQFFRAVYDLARPTGGVQPPKIEVSSTERGEP